MIFISVALVAGASLSSAIPTVPAEPSKATLANPISKAQSTSPAQAAKPAHFLGSWGGLRTSLTEAGITPNVAYVTQTLTNVRGGSRQVVRGSGQFIAGATVDLEKLAGLPGTFQATITRRHGKSFNTESGLNLLINPQAINGRGEVWRVGQFWYQTAIGPIDLKLGRMQLSETFDMARCDFVNGFFCQGENVRIAPTTWPETPISQWGGRLMFRATREVTLKIGAFQYNPKNLDLNRNLYIGWTGGTGYMVPAEIAFTPKIRGKLLGTYSVGVSYLDAPVDDPVLNTNGQIRQIYGGKARTHSSQWGYYLTARQQLMLPRADGSHALSVFFNLSTFTNKTARSHTAMGMGFNFSGLVPSRPKDEFGLGFGRARINNRVSEAIAAANAAGRPYAPVPSYEYAIEATYGLTVVPGLVMQPGVQFIFDPGGISERRNAILPEIKTTLTL